MRKVLVIILLLFLKLQCFSFHIVGGEMIYDDLGGGNYRITLKCYRDCAGGGSFFDGDQTGPTAWLTVFDASNNIEGIYNIGWPVVTPVPSAFNNPCIIAPNNICVEEGVYTYTVHLPPKAGGYTVVYQRCCRNSIIENLVNPDGQGATYFAKIPGPEEVASNNSPRFSKFPPIYICKSVAFNFDHSAVDPDGDQLVYSLCAPYAGLDGCCPVIAGPVSNLNCISPPAVCPSAASPPPYSNVLFYAPYSGANPIDGNPAFSIDPVTGYLAGTPTLTGQYVVGVCIQEYRNNKLINTHFRDFQFTVINCTVTVVSSIADQKQQCVGQVLTFTNQSVNNAPQPVYHWDFGVNNLSNDTSNLLNPVYAYPDTGIYVLTLITNPGQVCSDTLKKPIYVYPPLEISFTRPDKQCFRNNAFSFHVKGQYINETTFFWDFSLLAEPPSSASKDPAGIHFTEGGTLPVILMAKQFACRDTFIDSVKIIGRPRAKINNVQSGLCDPALVGFSNGSKCDLPLRYYWYFSNGKSSTAFEPSQIFSPDGIYSATLIAETTELCRDTSVAVLTNIVVHPKPKAAFTFTPRETSIFEPDVTVWSLLTDPTLTSSCEFGDGGTSMMRQVKHSYSEFGDYRIRQTVVNSFGCIDTLSDVVKILPEFRFWIPNSFTPDNDSRNDVFMPVMIGVRNYEFLIFDLWGELIFSTKTQEEGWNGFYKGLECQQGMYVWKAKYTNEATSKSEVRVGHVVLLRNP